MAQTTSLLITLKKALKTHGFTYADVAKHLQLTEASIKRLFSEENISLNRLDQICQMLELEISDLVQLMNEQQKQLHQLTKEQELEITKDVTLLLITVCVLNKWTMPEIIEQYQLSEVDCIQHLIKLDKLQIIELLPGNRIKLKVSPNFSWIENGPIQQFFQRTLGQTYFNSHFTKQDEKLIVLNGMLSNESNAEFQRKLKRLAREFNELNNDDAGLPLDERYGTTVVLALRGWRNGLFDKLNTPN